jgi:hypothetical protein
MSTNPTPDKRGDQIAETLTVHNLMRNLPPEAQDKLRQIALREHKSILDVTREAILSFTSPQPAAW